MQNSAELSASKGSGLIGTPFLYELRKTLILAAPITAGHVSHMLLGLTDTLMIGRVGVVALAAAALTNTFVNILLIVGIGLLTSVSIMVSHAYGAGKNEEVGEMLRRGLVIGVTGGLLIFAILWGSFPFLDLLGQPEEVVTATKPYLWLLAVSLPFVLATITFRNYSEAQNAPWPAFWCGFGSVLLNVFLNWVLIYGHLGFPALGLPGAGIATLISRILNFIVLVLWLRLDQRFIDSWPVRWLTGIPWSGLKSMLWLGFPVGLQLLMEVGAFSFTTILMGWIGVVEMAAHQVALTCASATFMFPLGISLAVAIRVGHVIGAGQPHRARGVAFSGLGFALVLGGGFTAMFLIFNQQIATLFVVDETTATMAATLMVVAGFFQLFDGAQALAVGALRGCKDVTIPTWIIFIAYWVVGIPLAALLAFGMGMGAIGPWIGLASGLGVAAIGLIWRFVRITSRIEYSH